MTSLAKIASGEQADSGVRECDDVYTMYFELIQRKYDAGKIDHDRYCFLIDKIAQWHIVACEREDD